MYKLANIQKGEILLAEIKELMDSGVNSIYTAAGAVVYYQGDEIFEYYTGSTGHGPDKEINESTLFDIASITKVFTATAFLKVFYSRGYSIEMPVVSIVPEFSQNSEPYDKSVVTFKHILTHSSGLPSWKPYYEKLKGDEIKKAVLSESLIYPPGSKVLYSDLGFMILGWALERITGKKLDEVIKIHLTEPLGLKNTGYGPFPCENTVATELCNWRKRRICGEVHDENAFALGGIAGHAGLFSTPRDVADFGLAWLDSIYGVNHLGLPRRIVIDAVSPQIEFQNQRRGLGWALWTPSSPARYLGKNTFGHTGFTGTSLFVDPDRKLVVSLMTNRVYFGRNPAPILLFRIKFHRKIAELTDSL